MTPVRLLLNSNWSGANAFIAQALRRGLFSDAGLELHCTPGRGAYTAAQRLADEGFDAAYGDLNALIELAAERSGASVPVAVLLVHQMTPCTITVAADGPIRQASDLAGRTLVGHASDVALRTFPVFARAAGLPPGAVQVRTSEAAMGQLLGDLLERRFDGVFGYVTTHTAALAALGQDAAAAVRFLPYRDVCPVLYGSAMMVAPGFVQRRPRSVDALVRVTLDAIALAQAFPVDAIDAVLALNPAAHAPIEHARWVGTWHADMACPSAWPCRTGDVDDARLQQSIAVLAQALDWPQAPLAERIFTRDHLPARGQ